MTEKVVDDLRKVVIPGSKLSIAAASFSLYAFETLKDELWKIDSLRFIFTSRTFVKKQVLKESREFDISRNAREQALNEEQSARERSLFGSEFELKLRNQLNQKAIAVECAEWIRQKVKFRTNITDLNYQTLMHVKPLDDDALYTPFPLFSARCSSISASRALFRNSSSIKWKAPFLPKSGSPFLNYSLALAITESSSSFVIVTILSLHYSKVLGYWGGL